jgi:hypothetical protein
MEEMLMNIFLLLSVPLGLFRGRSENRICGIMIVTMPF